MAHTDELIRLLARLPGLGPRSARRVALSLITRKDRLMRPLGRALLEVADSIGPCGVCGNLDDSDPCALCRDPRRDDTVICVVEQMGDLWALERTGSFRGRYHVLGGVLSALDGIGPEDLNIAALLARVGPETPVREVILATNLTVDGQTTAHYLTDRLPAGALKLTRLAHGVPVGGELDYLDDGTLSTALQARRSLD